MRTTFAQLADPSTIPAGVQHDLKAIDRNAAHPRNLFRVHWFNAHADGAFAGVVVADYRVTAVTEVFGAAFPFEDRIAALTQLPWLREGFMPAWLRSALIPELEPARAAEVRAALQELIGRATATGGSKEILTPLFTVTGQNLLIGLFVSIALFARVDAFFFALVALGVSMIVTASSVVVEFNDRRGDYWEVLPIRHTLGTIVRRLQAETGIRSAAHLTCVGAPRAATSCCVATMHSARRDSGTHTSAVSAREPG